MNRKIKLQPTKHTKNTKTRLNFSCYLVSFVGKRICTHLSSYIFSILFLTIVSPSYAEIQLPKLFTNNMVLQRDMQVKIWGWAEKGENIKLAFMGNTFSTVANESGEWIVQLPASPVGGPYKMTIAGENTIHLKNIMFGDVWVCSGQSNMYFRVAAAKNSYKDINEANYKNIRLFQIDKDSNYKPKKDLASGEWLECSPKTVRKFSAVAYFFGRELHKKIDVPIGLIHTSWGGSKIQAWMDAETIKDFDDYRKQVEKIKKTPDYFAQLEQEYEEKGGNLLVKAIYKQDPGFNDDGTLSDNKFLNEKNWKDILIPGYWEDSELPGYNGIVWYRKKMELPKVFQDKDLLLDLGWVDDYDFTFFNGKRVGETFYKGTERRYKIPKEIIKNGVNEILVCVYDSYGKGGFWGPRKSHIKIDKDVSGLQISLQGLWQYKPGLDKKNIVSPKSNKQPRKRETPTFLYNAMISPLTQFSIKGVIWYQGESNAGSPAEYSHLFPAMIKGWRNIWNQGDFPFLFVQLHNYSTPNDEPKKSDWAEQREAQFKTLILPNTGMTVAIDLGVEMDIHPTNKQDVGKRLALSALKVAYDRDLVFSGPIYDSMKIKNGKAYISFNHVGNGLIANDKFGYLNEFAIAGADKKFVWAKAYIDGNNVVVYSEKIPKPKAVRYAWSINPSHANLYNKEGLPASPFRTDNWND